MPWGLEMPLFRTALLAITSLTILFTSTADAQNTWYNTVFDTDASPTEFPDFANKNFASDFIFVPDTVSPARWGPASRTELYFTGHLLSFEGGSILGEVATHQGAFIELDNNSSIRGVRLGGTMEDDFGFLLNHGGNVDALDPRSGVVDIHGGVTRFGSYSPEGAPVNPLAETEAAWKARVSALTTAANGYIGVRGGTLGASITPGPNGDLSLGEYGFLDISGGTIEASFGEIAGQFNISGGDFPDLSVGSITGDGRISILGTDLQFNGTAVGDQGLTIDQTGGTITGFIPNANGDALSTFEFNVPEITGNGSILLANDTSELQITQQNTSGATNGGADFAGGVEVDFEVVITDGNFFSDALTTGADDLAQTVASTVAPDFELSSEEAVQHWELDFNGSFENEAELVFGYDELLLDVPEEELAIYHFDEELGIWESLEFIEHDMIRNSIRVRTRSFSPFVLGATSSVPEPSGSILIAGLLLQGLKRRRDIE